MRKIEKRTRKSKEQRIGEIIETGKKLLLEKGFSLTAKEIAERIGVSETYIYTFFPNKKAIFEAIYRDHFLNIGAMIRLGEAGPEYKERLVSYFMEFYRNTEKTRTLELLYLFALEKSENKPGLEVFRTVVPLLTQPMEEFLKSGIQKGYFRELDPVSAADFIHSAFFHLIYHHTIFLRTDLDDRLLREKIECYLDFFLRGIVSGDGGTPK